MQQTAHSPVKSAELVSALGRSVTVDGGAMLEAVSAEEFDSAIYDLTNFLYYVSEPARLERQRTGVFVLLFLIILGSFTYLLNREYWKDIEH